MLAEVTVTWPDACVSIVGFIVFGSFLIGNWPWEGFINKTYICKCKKNCPCKDQNDEDDDEE